MKRFLILWIVWWALMTTSAHAGQPAESDRADLYIECAGAHLAKVTMSIDGPPGDIGDLRAALQRSLHASLHSIKIDEADDIWTLTARSADLLRAKGLITEGAVDPTPLRGLLRNRNCRWLCVYILHGRTPYASEMPPASRDLSTSSRYERYYAISVTAPRKGEDRAISFSYGYSVIDAATILLSLFALLSACIVLAYRAQRQALREPDTTAAWFGYVRFSRTLSTGLWLAWITLFLALNVDRFADFIAGDGSSERYFALLALVGLLPPMVTRLACAAIAHPVFALTGSTEWTRGDLVVQSFWNQARQIIPIGMALTAIGGLIDNHFQHSILWIVAAIVALRFCTMQFIRAAQFTPLPLSVGELRDHLFQIAEAAKVQIRQIYYLPAGKGRMANAFAMQNNDILLTDYLIRHLSRREVDAVAGHEVTHLRHKHPVRLAQIRLLIGGLPVFVALFYGFVYSWDITGLLVWAPSFALLALFVSHLVSRRYEIIADAGAVSLTGDPEAMITGLVKITQLSHLPIAWGKGAERTLTHPSTERRAEAIARRAGIPAERLQELLQNPDMDPERYLLPAGLEDDRVYTPLWRHREQSRKMWIQYAAVLITPTIFAWAGQMLRLKETALWWLWLVGLIVTIGVYLTAMNFGMQPLAAELERRLRFQMATQTGMIEPGSTFVTLSPADEPRQYDGARHWDVGFLKMDPDRLTYVGEQARFALHRDHIREVSVAPGWPGWLPAPDIRIVWEDQERGTQGVLSLRPGNGGSALRTAAAVSALQRQLVSWRHSPTGTGPAGDTLDALGTPETGVITSDTIVPGKAARLMFGTIIILAILAAVIDLMLGLSFRLERGSALYLVSVAGIMGIIMWLPYLVPYRRRAAASHPRMTGIVLAVLFGAAMVQGGIAKAADHTRPVTLDSLIQEMTDRDALARRPDPPFVLKQSSSHDPAKRDPGDEASWHSNQDFGQFIRTEVHDGRREWVIMDEAGPGAVTRFWLPLNSDKDKQVIRFYLDGAPTPALTANFNELLSGRGIVKPPFAFVAWNSADVREQMSAPPKVVRGVAGDLYLPIPYAKSCKITLDQVPFYYIIDYRSYAPRTNVRTFTMPQLEEAKARLSAAADAITNTTSRSGGSVLVKPRASIEPGGETTLPLGQGPGCVREVEIRIDPKDAPQVLRSLVLIAEFDGDQTIWCPIGDLTGSGVRLRAVHDRFRTAEENGRLRLSWTMPFRRSGQLSLRNVGSQPVTASLSASTAPWKWDDRSLLFHANWHSTHSIKTRPRSDWNYIDIQGDGQYVGDTLTVYSPVGDWYGEGDERIYLNGETFPSHIGTGTEDYYGYAWGMASFFSSPWLSAPQRDRDDRGDWRGYTTTSRMRILDGIPMTSELKVDMEIWDWADTQVDYAVATFWYGRPGATHNRTPEPAEAAAPVRAEPPSPMSFKIEGALECETLRIAAKSNGVQVSVQNAGLREGQWSAGKQLFVQASAIGDYVELEVPAIDALPHRLLVYATKSFDYGILRFSVNGKRAGADYDAYSAEPVASGPIDVGSVTAQNGKLLVRIEVVGSNPASKDRRVYFGLDCFVLKML